MNKHFAMQCWRIVAAAAVLLLVCSRGAVAAEPQFVGVLALAVQAEVAEELELSQEQKEKLLQLIDAREDEVLELVLELGELPRSARQERLAPFRRESESMGLRILSQEQRTRLEGIRIRRSGIDALAEPAVAEKLALSAEQRGRIVRLLQARQQRLVGADPQAARVAHAETRRQLFAVLTAQQQANWDGLMAGKAPRQRAPAAADPPPRPPGPDSPVPTGEIAETTRPGPPKDAVAPDLDDMIGKPEADRPPSGPGMLRFAFRYQPWGDVLDWFAERAGLSLEYDAPPQGTFNYTDDREYTPVEALDLINSVLLTKGYTLVRRERMLMLVNLEDEIPPHLVSTITEDELDQRGEFELVTVLFQLDKANPEEVAQEIAGLVGRQGSVVPLPKSRQIKVREMAGQLRAIRSIIRRIEDPEGLTTRQLRLFDLNFLLPDEAMGVIRQMLDIPEDQNAASDGSIRVVIDPSGGRLLASGTSEKLQRVDEILKTIDMPGPGEVPEAGRIAESLQLEVYSTTTADPQMVLKVIQTLMADHPGVRLDISPATNSLIVLARPSEHLTIKAVLAQMQTGAQQVEVIQLRRIDPQLAVLSINKLFGSGGETPAANAPQVDAYPSTRQLMIRGTEPQIAQIRELLQKMGESDVSGTGLAGGGKVRMLPLSGQSVNAALERIQEIWPTMRRNRIRIVTPSAVVPTMRSGGSGAADGFQLESSRRLQGLRLPSTALPSQLLPRRPASGERMQQEPRRPGSELPGPGFRRPFPGMRGPNGRPPMSAPPAGSPPQRRSTGLRGGARVFFASQAPPAEPGASDSPADAAEPNEPQPDAPQPDTPQLGPTSPATQRSVEPAVADDSKNSETAEEPAAPADELAPIIVAPGPGGTMIASEDTAALNEFESLLTTLTGGTASGPELTFFFLKYAKASSLAETLDQILGGGTLASESGGGGLIGDLASSALGSVGGGIVGAMLGLDSDSGGSFTPSGSIRIIPNSRLNALIVQARPADVEIIDQLLRVLDRAESPEEIMAVSKARMVPVFNTLAEEIAEIIQQVYRDRMVTGAREGGGRQPSPEDLIRMLRGGRGGDRGSRGSRTEDVQKMSIGVDTRSNSIIVAAPDTLFQEVRNLIEQLDVAAVEGNTQAVQVVTLHKASPEAVQSALASLLGDGVQVSRSGGSSSRGSSRGSSSRGASPRPSDPSSDARRAAFIEMMRSRFGGGRPGGRPPGGGRPGGDRGGGRPGGGRPGGGPPGGGR